MVETTSSGSFIITSSPRLVKRDKTDIAQKIGMIKEIPLSGDLGIGITDRIFLIGHADGLELNDPHQVVNLQDTINTLGADTNSPLMRGLFDVYNEGARDIWLVAAAPMSEYIEGKDFRNTPIEYLGDNTFYEQYHTRLDTTYELLKDFDEVEIIVPLEAPFHDAGGADFLTQLSNHCEDGLATTGRIRIGFIGTRLTTYDGSEVAIMTEDSRLSTVSASAGGKFVILVGGEVSVNHSHIEVAYSASASTLAAAKLAVSRADRGLTYNKFKSAISPNQKDYSDDILSSLALAKINWIGRSKLGNRGVPYQVHMKSDNTLAEDESMLWAVSQLRIMSKVVNNVQAIGSRFIGTIGYPQFKDDVRRYMDYLVSDLVIKSYSLNIYRDDTDRNKAIVDVNIRPHGTLREVFLSVAVGNTSTI
jgi:hypothetical protein